MKLFVYMSLLVLTLVMLIVLPCFSEDAALVTGKIYISSTNLVAEIYSSSEPQCDCCPPLWNGGIAITTDKLTEIEIEDMACIRLLGGYRLYAECVEIVPCILINNQLISWRGIISPYGDIVIYSCGYAYRFTIL